MARMLLWIVLWLMAATASHAAPGQRWTAVWWSSQLALDAQNALPAADLTDATLRQIIRLQGPATRLRLRLSNRFGTAPLRIDGVSIARAVDPAGARIDPATLRSLRFGGALSVMIPAGADYWSDPVDLPVPAGTDLAVSLYVVQPPARQTGHPGSRATSYLVHGDRRSDADLPGASTVDHWFQIAGVEALAPANRAVVVFGDSITDGYGVKPNTNSRWTDVLQRRLRAEPGMGAVAVLNAGIGGNRLLNDGLGPNALARFDHDVLSQPGVTHLIVLEGVNDLGTLTRDAPATPEAHAALVARMIDAYRQIVARARTHGIKAIGVTILPYGASAYYHPDALNEADRQAVNRWIRAPGNFDAVLDLDAAMRDPADPTRLRKDFDGGDGLHPSVAGYAAMAQAVPLALLR